eukprot:8424639-Alexandrium_andersonii.AAC.1
MASTFPFCKTSSVGCGAALHIETDGDDETGRPARRRRFSDGVRGAERPPRKTNDEYSARLNSA